MRISLNINTESMSYLADFLANLSVLLADGGGSSDDRYLWPEMREAYRQCEPVWIIPENVYGFANWDDGAILETVCSDLESDGYQVQPFIIPASGANAGHERQRVWLIAYSAQRRLQRRLYSDTERHGQTADRPISPLVENRDWTTYAKSFISRGVYGLSDRVDRTQALGNAIVPQVAMRIFETIEKWELLYAV